MSRINPMSDAIIKPRSELAQAKLDEALELTAEITKEAWAPATRLA